MCTLYCACVCMQMNSPLMFVESGKARGAPKSSRGSALSKERLHQASKVSPPSLTEAYFTYHYMLTLSPLTDFTLHMKKSYCIVLQTVKNIHSEVRSCLHACGQVNCQVSLICIALNNSTFLKRLHRPPFNQPP